MPRPDLVIVGPTGNTHIAGSLARAAAASGLRCRLQDTALAYRGPALQRAFLWHMGGHRPYELRSFSQNLFGDLATVPPRWLIAMGHAPILSDAIHALRKLNVVCLNYASDDPWNGAHRAGWHLRALPAYDIVFTPRRANIDDLSRLGCADVRYLPFGYDERLFGLADARIGQAGSGDGVLFVGGGDRDRADFFARFMRNGLRPALVGGYWDRYAHTHESSLGLKSAEEVRSLTAQAAVNLCLVRRANRDGHVMRSFEIPACGGFMIAEESAEHREILGAEGECALFFSSPEEAAAKACRAIADAARRRTMAANAHNRITRGAHTYRDRLQYMLEASNA